MSRKIFHRIDEIPRKTLLNNSKRGGKYLKNPVVWIFTECCCTPYFCGAVEYKLKVKELMEKAEKTKLNPPVFWAYRADLVPYDEYLRMFSEASKRNFYKDMKL